MTTRLLLVRHGQASIDAPDYDQLSQLGHEQCRRLGHYLQQHGVEVATALHGTLRRHRESFQAIVAGGTILLAPATAHDGLDEYDFRAVLTAYAQAHQGDPEVADAMTRGGRAWLRHLKPAMTRWMTGQLDVPGSLSYRAFSSNVGIALELASRHSGTVLAVTSGGVIATLMARVLGLSAQAAVQMNLNIENSSVTEMISDGTDWHLVRFNSVAHLPEPHTRSVV